MANNRRLIKFMTPDLGLALVRGYSGPVWRSTDAGISWSKVLDGCYTALATVPQAFVVAAGLEGSFATSQNAGETWVQVKLPVSGDIVAITASDPLNITITTKVRGESFERDRLYKEDGSKLLISRDGGKRWTEISMPSGDFETRDLETTGAGKIWLLQAPTKTNKLILSSTSIEIERVRASHSMSEKETERLAGLLQGQRVRRRFS
jgi:BNR/Asp-box repeat